MKKQIFGLAVLAFLLALSVSAPALWAQATDQPKDKARPGPGQMAPGDWYGNLGPEKQKIWDTAWQEHQAKMQPLRDQMWRKSMEYEALAGNPNLKPEDFRALIDEMADLKLKMRAEGQGFRDKLAKDGLSQPWGCGAMSGPGPGKGGPGYGYGYHHRGKGGRPDHMGYHGGWHRGGY